MLIRSARSPGPGRSLPFAALVAVLGAATLSGCVSHHHPCATCSPKEEGKAAKAAAAPAADAEKVADLERQIELGDRKLERARMDRDQQQRDAEAAVGKAHHELDAAKIAANHFEEFEKPQKLARAALDLKNAADNMSDQREEMQQLELMYEQDDLADKTKEIVLARGKRGMERAAERYALAKKEAADLQGFQLAEQRRKLDQALEEKKRELQKAEFAAKSGAMDKDLAVHSQKLELEKLHRELAKAKGGAAAEGKAKSGEAKAKAAEDKATAEKEKKKASAEHREKLKELGYVDDDDK